MIGLWFFFPFDFYVKGGGVEMQGGGGGGLPHLDHDCGQPRACHGISSVSQNFTLVQPQS